MNRVNFFNIMAFTIIGTFFSTTTLKAQSSSMRMFPMSNFLKLFSCKNYECAEKNLRQNAFVVVQDTKIPNLFESESASRLNDQNVYFSFDENQQMDILVFMTGNKMRFEQAMKQLTELGFKERSSDGMLESSQFPAMEIRSVTNEKTASFGLTRWQAQPFVILARPKK